MYYVLAYAQIILEDYYMVDGLYLSFFCYGY